MPNELLVLEKVEMVPFFTKGQNVKDVLSAIEEEALSFVPDVTTAKGRAAIKAMVTKVTKSKTYLEKHGKDLAAEYKAIPKVIDANRREVKDRLTTIAEAVRAPLTQYEAEQAEIERLNLVEADHEIGLLLNEKYDKERAEHIEQERKAEEDRQTQLKAEQEEREKRIAEEAAENARKAEISRQEAEAKRITDEKAALEANKQHVSKILSEAKQSIMDLHFGENQAKAIVNAIRKNEIANVTINY